ncbi:MAG: VOC family protein [Saprospiraceae bacterium]
MSDTKTYGLTHLAIAVADLNRTLRFYQKVFNMEVMYHTEDFLQLTTPGAHDVIVFLKKETDLIGVAGGIDHFGFRLRYPNDISEIEQKVIDAGGTITDRGEFAPGYPKLFFKDPDGYVVEVWYE